MPEEIKKPTAEKLRQGDIETALRFGAAVGQCRSPIDDTPGAINGALALPIISGNPGL
jgi:hypothetical protein